MHDDVTSFWVYAPAGQPSQKRRADGALAHRKFFERRPYRRHRVRLASRFERQQYAAHNGPLPPASALHAAVRCVRTSVRARAFLAAPRGRETDVDEVIAAGVFEAALPPNLEDVAPKICGGGA
jgi:hypothetical protein